MLNLLLEISISQIRKMEIKSEIRFQLKLFLKIIALPLTLLLFLLGQWKLVKKLSPLKEILDFLTSAKTIFALIIANILAYIGQVILLLTKPGALDLFVKYPKDILGMRFYTVITSGFLHGNIGHLLANMLFLLLVGRVVEKKLGRKKTLLVYFLALIISGTIDSLLSMYLGIEAGAIGASGAIMGLVSIAMLLAPLYITFLFFIPLPMFLIGWTVLASNLANLPNYASSNIGYIAHLAGFFSIALIGALLSSEDKKKLRNGLIVNLVFLVVGTIIFVIIQGIGPVKELISGFIQTMNGPGGI